MRSLRTVLALAVLPSVANAQGPHRPIPRELAGVRLLAPLASFGADAICQPDSLATEVTHCTRVLSYRPPRGHMISVEVVRDSIFAINVLRTGPCDSTLTEAQLLESDRPQWEPRFGPPDSLSRSGAVAFWNWDGNRRTIVASRKSDTDHGRCGMTNILICVPMPGTTLSNCLEGDRP
jgi:hypothetical protein